MLGMYFLVLRYFAFVRQSSRIDTIGCRILIHSGNLKSKMVFSFFNPLIIIFSTEEKPKKRNEKECQSRSTELREVCQGLR